MSSFASAPALFLEWDSSFWGFGVGKVVGDVLTPARAAELDAWAEHHDVSCLYFLAPSDDHETLDIAQRSEFRLVDVRLELEQQMRDPEPAYAVRPYAPGDLDALRAIARVSHGITRFYADPHFDRDRCADLYETWIVRSCEERWADDVLVLDRGGRASGYVTCNVDQAAGSGSIGLIAVAEDARGGGGGRELVHAALTRVAASGAGYASVVTQGANVAAQRLFQACGFRTSSTKLWFHRWYDR